MFHNKSELPNDPLNKPFSDNEPQEKPVDFVKVKNYVYSGDPEYSETKIGEYVRLNGHPEEDAKKLTAQIMQLIAEAEYDHAINLTMSVPIVVNIKDSVIEL